MKNPVDTFPSPLAIRQAVSKIRHYMIEQPTLLLRMGEPIPYRHSCQTVACLAGFYALAKHSGEVSFDHHPPKLESTGRSLFFSFCGNLFATDLGMPEQNTLENWAKDHPELWGRENGKLLLSSMEAYTDDPQEQQDESLNIVLNHWLAVAERIENHQAERNT